MFFPPGQNVDFKLFILWTIYMEKGSIEDRRYEKIPSPDAEDLAFHAGPEPMPPRCEHGALPWWAEYITRNQILVPNTFVAFRSNTFICGGYFIRHSPNTRRKFFFHDNNILFS